MSKAFFNSLHEDDQWNIRLATRNWEMRNFRRKFKRFDPSRRVLSPQHDDDYEVYM
jgi:hypothetical protein